MHAFYLHPSVDCVSPLIEPFIDMHGNALFFYSRVDVKGWQARGKGGKEAREQNRVQTNMQGPETDNSLVVVGSNQR